MFRLPLIVMMFAVLVPVSASFINQKVESARDRVELRTCDDKASGCRR